jgi:hypothetical protein
VAGEQGVDDGARESGIPQLRIAGCGGSAAHLRGAAGGPHRSRVRPTELQGGDAWDRQIRKQIHDCALFIPIISAHSESRLEGYFRREWKLASDRTHNMAEEKAFLVPVVIDDTRRTPRMAASRR